MMVKKKQTNVKRAIRLPARALVGITERKRAEEALRESEDRYRDLVENSQDLICTHDLEGHVLTANPSAARLLGYDLSELIGSNLRDYLAPEVRAHFQHYINRLKRNGTATGLLIVQTKTGERRIWEYNNTVRVAGVAQPIVRGMARDVTERKQAEEALRQSEARNRALVEQAADGIFIANTQGHYLDVNTSGCAMLGYTREEILGMDYTRILLPEDLAQDPPKLDVLIAGKTLVRERLYRRKDGTVFPVEISAKMLSDGRIQSIVRDITERKRAEEQLRVSESSLQAVLQSTADGVLAVNRENQVIFANERFVQLWRIPPQVIASKDDALLLQHVLDQLIDPQSFLQKVRALYQSEEASFDTLYFKDGRIFERLSRPLIRAANLSGRVWSFRDITERMQAEKALRESEVSLKASQRVAHVGHWAWNTRENKVTWSDEMHRIFGLDPEKFAGDLDQIVERAIHPDDREKVVKANQAVMKEQKSASLEYRVVWPDQSVHTVWAVPGDKVVDTNGKILKLTGIVQDITERKRAEEALRRRADEFAALYEITRDLTLQLDWSSLLQTITEKAIALLNVDSSLIYFYDPATDDLELAVVNGMNVPVGTRLTMGEGVAGRVAKTRAPLKVDNYQEWDQRSPKYQGVPIAAALAVPMLYGGQLIGVLGVSRAKKTERKFSEADEHLLALFAVQAAGAVHGTRLLDETRRRADEFAALYNVTHDLAAQPDVDVLLNTIVQRATELLAAPSGTICLYDPARDDLMIAAIKGTELPVGTRIKIGEGAAGIAAQTRAPLIVANYSQWEHRLPQYEGNQFGAAATVPMLYGGQLIGTLNIIEAGSSPRQFTEADLDLLTLFAGLAAGAVHNASLLDGMSQRLAELEAVSQVSTALRAATTLDEMLPLLLDKTLGALNIDSGLISLYDKASGELYRAVARGAFGTKNLPLPIRPGAEIGGDVLATGEAYGARETANDPQTLESARSRLPEGMGTAHVPIRAEAETIGTLDVAFPLPREIRDSEVRLLLTLADIAGNAIQRIRLHAQTEVWLRQLQALHAIDIAITGSTDLKVTLNFLLSQVAVQLHVDAASILLLNPLMQTLEYAAGHGFRTRGIEQSRLRLGEGYAGKAALERETLHASNLQDAGADFARAKLLSDEGFIGYYAVPLISKGQVKGVLDIFQRAPLEPQPAWLDFLQALATQAAIAIDNAQLFENLEHSNTELTLAYDTTIEGWSRALDLRDKETEGHTLRVTEITLRLAKAMGVGDASLVHIRRGALLHDIGKMGVPDNILLKPDKLTDAEWHLMRQHPQLAFELLAPIAFLRSALDVPYCHHEKWDGTGYPRGLVGAQIPLAARIFAIVDVWDAVTSDRPYRAAWSREQALEHIREQSGKYFDPRVVEIFLREIEGR